jgi:hypothetical protein
VIHIPFDGGFAGVSLPENFAKQQVSTAMVEDGKYERSVVSRLNLSPPKVSSRPASMSKAGGSQI